MRGGNSTLSIFIHFRDEARQWPTYSLEPGEISSRESIVEKFMKKYFPSN